MWRRRLEIKRTTLESNPKAKRTTVVLIGKVAAQPDLRRQNLTVAPNQIVVLQLEQSNSRGFECPNFE